MRIYINGKLSAFQADDMGSIPIIRFIQRVFRDLLLAITKSLSDLLT